jgi:acyl-coenzyme A thioesterase 13
MNSELLNVHKVWERIRSNSPIYAFLLENVEIYEAQKGIVRARIMVSARHLNSKGTLHGTFSACVIDWAGGMVIASHGIESTGVSTDIHVSYLSTAKIGDWLEIESHASKIGKTLAFTTVAIHKRDDYGQLFLVAQGSHTKYIKQGGILEEATGTVPV